MKNTTANPNVGTKRKFGFIYSRISGFDLLLVRIIRFPCPQHNEPAAPAIGATNCDVQKARRAPSPPTSGLALSICPGFAVDAARSWRTWAGDRGEGRVAREVVAKGTPTDKNAPA